MWAAFTCCSRSFIRTECTCCRTLLYLCSVMLRSLVPSCGLSPRPLPVVSNLSFCAFHAKYDACRARFLSSKRILVSCSSASRSRCCTIGSKNGASLSNSSSPSDKLLSKSSSSSSGSSSIAPPASSPLPRDSALEDAAPRLDRPSIMPRLASSPPADRGLEPVPKRSEPPSPSSPPSSPLTASPRSSSGIGSSCSASSGASPASATSGRPWSTLSCFSALLCSRYPYTCLRSTSWASAKASPCTEADTCTPSLVRLAHKETLRRVPAPS
mmetsp:Transcript_38834/g.101565  ORF Transcript_38834/g.101565 Transcript_38834/m.101565 type:complete len:270 (+) Transcript_38834:1160-1969(+)